MSAVLACAAILFDLDGVLVDSRAVVERTWQRWAAHRGVNDSGLTRRAHGRRSIDTVRDVAPSLNADEEVRWLEAAELADFDGVHDLPGAATATGALSDSEWAVVTSGGQELARRRLAHANLRIPRIVVAAEDVKLGKPAPDGYQLAAAQLGVDPASCLVIEDTPAGIQSGRLAGAQVLALTTTFPETTLLGATVVVNSLADVEIRRVASGLLVHVMHGVA
jgi:sugar-phosphatase